MLPPSFFAKSGFTLRARPVVRWTRRSGVARLPRKPATSTPGDASHFASGGVLRALPGARASCAPGLGAATADGALPPGLQSIVELDAVRDQRDEAIQNAWRMIDSHVAGFWASMAEREAVPVVADLRAHFEAVRDEILAEQPSTSAEDISRRLINRLLHGPSGVLRGAACNGGADYPMADAARRMFGLDDETQRAKQPVPGEPGREDE